MYKQIKSVISRISVFHNTELFSILLMGNVLRCLYTCIETEYINYAFRRNEWLLLLHVRIDWRNGGIFPIDCHHNHYIKLILKFLNQDNLTKISLLKVFKWSHFVSLILSISVFLNILLYQQTWSSSSAMDLPWMTHVTDMVVNFDSWWYMLFPWLLQGPTCFVCHQTPW